MLKTRVRILMISAACIAMVLLGGCGLLGYMAYSDQGQYGQPIGGFDEIELYDIQPADNAEWTVLFYLCGTDLESQAGAATDNLYELLDLPGNDNFNMAVQTGGTKYWWNDAMDSRYLERWMLKDGELLIVDQQPLASMGAGSTLGDFLSWGVDNFPAEKYMLVIWDHGGGSINGLVYDELYAYDSLDLNELAQGLAMAGARFELVGFDACLMSTLETAAAIAPYAEYMVASEEYEPSQGWDYSVWPAYLEDHSGWGGLELGRIICDSYYAKCRAYGNEAMATLAVTELAAIPQLVASFDAMADEMTGVAADINKLREFTRGAARAENYGGNNSSEGYTNMVDLGDLAINTESVLSDTADKVLDDLFAAVKYEVHGSSRSSANGLAVYYPLNMGYGELARYADVAVSGQYLRFISAISGQELPSWAEDELPQVTAPVVEQDDYQVTMETYINEDGYFELHIISGLESVQSVQFRLYFVDHENKEYVLMGYDNDIDFSGMDQGIYYDNFRGVWPTVEGFYCAPELLAEEPEYNLYSIPILLNGEEMNLRAAWIWQDEGGYFEIYGARSSVDEDTGMSPRDIIQLAPGDKVELRFTAKDWKSGRETVYSMGNFTVDGSGTVSMAESDLFDGEYMYQFVVTDVFGRDYYSDEVVMEVDGGDIYLYETY